MSILYETTNMGNPQLPNRFVRWATGMGMASEDGSCTPKLIDTMTELARGGVGLIITGHLNRDWISNRVLCLTVQTNILQSIRE